MWKYILVIITLPGFGQNPDTLYYDINWNLTEPFNAMFYRVADVDLDKLVFDVEVKDYYKSSKRLILVGFYIEGVKEGKFTFYHLNGRIESSGDYANNKKTGQWKHFYADNKIFKVIEHIPDNAHNKDETPYLLHELWDSSGSRQVVNGNGYWLEYDRNTDNNQRIVLQGKVTAGKKEDTWTLKYETGELIFEEFFKDNVFQFGDLWENKVKYPYYPSKLASTDPAEITKPELFVYNTYLRDRAYFGQGLEYFLHLFLGDKYDLTPTSLYQSTNKIILPCKEENFTPIDYSDGPIGLYRQFNKLKQKNTASTQRTGKVIIQLKVNHSGKIQQFYVVKGLSTQQNKQAIVLIKDSIFLPALCDDQPISHYTRIAVTFYN